ncbi:MAG TPA: NAD(P)-dependent oxidoreductase [Solirubrobacterales bacterium]|nr:NAD(P)-dependent oxidoreductase [Solirubrobacterales bacterium]
MKVFVAGATGAIGQPLVRQLVAAGHEVTGMSRSEERAASVRAAGAEAAVCDVYDTEALDAAVAAAAPAAVVHALTALPPAFNPRKNYLAATNRVRTEGTRNLIAAAQAAGARRLVAESVCFFYRPDGDWVKDEEAPLYEEAPGHFREGAAAMLDLERQVTSAEGLEGLVLRCGWLYGPGTYFAADGSSAEEVRRRRYPLVGAGTGTFSFLHVEDCAAAFAAALEHGAAGAYNVCDDEPAPAREWIPVYAEALGAKPPRRVPLWLARIVAGRAMAESAVQLRGAANAKAKRELGWQPAHPSWRQGLPGSVA